MEFRNVNRLKPDEKSGSRKREESFLPFEGIVLMGFCQVNEK